MDRQGGGRARTGNHLRRRTRHRRSEGDDPRRARPAGRRRPRLPAARGRGHQHRHDRPERLRRGAHGHLLHAADGARRARRADPRSSSPTASSAAGFSVDPDIAKVSVVGAGMRSHPGVAADIFEALADAGINIEIISTSAIRVSCVVPRGRGRARRERDPRAAAPRRGRALRRRRRRRRSDARAQAATARRRRGRVDGHVQDRAGEVAARALDEVRREPVRAAGRVRGDDQQVGPEPRERVLQRLQRIGVADHPGRVDAGQVQLLDAALQPLLGLQVAGVVLVGQPVPEARVERRRDDEDVGVGVRPSARSPRAACRRRRSRSRGRGSWRG